MVGVVSKALLPEAHLDGWRFQRLSQSSCWSYRRQVGYWAPVTGVTDGLVGVVSRALLPEAHLDVPKASTLHWNL